MSYFESNEQAMTHSIALVLTADMEEEDLNGLKGLMEEDGLIVNKTVRASREIESFKEALFCLFMEGFSLVLTFGGIGMESDDIVPEATGALIDKRLPALEGAIMYSLMEKGAYSILNRGICGLFHSTVVINLPNKQYVIREILNTIIPLLKQGLYNINIG
ncbi:MAG: MogA/MoaB family molybdenum cofactor biosynthesis protein [Thermotogota bacterium]